MQHNLPGQHQADPSDDRWKNPRGAFTPSPLVACCAQQHVRYAIKKSNSSAYQRSVRLKSGATPISAVVFVIALSIP
jgi:hypothetical protein